MKFENINVKGYRRLFNIEIQMRSLSVMIGPNGVGKTSILEVFSLLASSANGKLKETVSNSGGIQEIITSGKSDDISFNLSMSGPNNKHLVYDLSLKPKGLSYEISSENLSHLHGGYNDDPFKYIESYGSDIEYYNPEKNKLEPPNWKHSYFETSLSQVPKMYKEPEIFRNQMASCTYYSAYALTIGHDAPIRLPQKMQPATHPGTNGEYLVSCLYYLRETDRDSFEAVEDTLSVAFPGFLRLNFPPVAAGTIAMTWEDENFTKPVYMTQLSEGMLRFLWLVTLLQSPDLTAITLIDEPEVSLHPQLLSILSETFREASKRTQLIIATHSGHLIRFMEPSEVIVFDSEEGLTNITWADNLDLNEWLKEYNLEELWTMGRIGGKV
ncbi:MAG: AAA family ATPase [Desulfobacteraceae bacterium]|nr:AAA family ATPase [Desulfobacteraceae bacterium]